MSATLTAPPCTSHQAGDLEALRADIESAAHLLPAQGPINVFIHHNTLHAFEHLPFHEAVRRGGEIFGCEPYLTEARFRDELERGRIRFDELRQVLRDDLGAAADEVVAGLASRLDLRRAMLRFPLQGGAPAEIRWFVAESDALRKVRPGVGPEVRGKLIAETRHWVLRDLRGGNQTGHGPAWLGKLFSRFPEGSIEEWSNAIWEAFTLHAMWHACREKVEAVPAPPPPPEPVRHRDQLLRAAAVDTDEWVHEPLVRIVAAFLDQGVSAWPLPNREAGLYRAFLGLYQQAGHCPRMWLRTLPAEVTRLQREGLTPLQLVQESLDELGVNDGERPEYLSETLLALGGWGGIMRQIEERGDRAPIPAPHGSLIELLAVRLLLERLALREAAREALNYAGPLSGLRAELRRRNPPRPAVTPEGWALAVFQLAQVLGWPANRLQTLPAAGWEALVREVEAFNELERRRIFHLAYEHRFFSRSLDAVASRAGGPDPTPAAPRFQAVFCLDEREESFRRHLEEVAPDCQTFGAAAFYGVAMYYRGAADAHFVPKCPIVLTPGHWVEEEPDGCHGEAQRLATARKALGRATFGFHRGSQSFALGALLTAVVGGLASIPLVLRVLFPRFSSRVSNLFGRFLRAPARTRLTLERQEPKPGKENGARGYSVEEMTAIAERQLRDIGLINNFARIVLTHGHGSESLNNPHKSAYDCGACGGSPGGANGRALAAMLNDRRVREGLAKRGLHIPEQTWFIGGYHNTCNDSVVYYDVDRLPTTHVGEFLAIRREIDEACRRNAHERCRRFHSAALKLSFEAAHAHVEARSEDIAQTRPELGHATNALCIVGRRSRTRGLFLDRRAFLTSYDPTQDDAEATILERILAAAVPVCAGINLEYYFSHVDSAGWGCGTKLPHNVASLLGVMDGASSDLRTGLPWQMVEIHEPVRLLFIVETTPEAMVAIMDRNEVIGRNIRNGWVKLAVLDPHSATIRVYHDGEFREHPMPASPLPRAMTSVDWYRGWRDHLEFALVGEVKT